MLRAPHMSSLSSSLLGSHCCGCGTEEEVVHAAYCVCLIFNLFLAVDVFGMHVRAAHVHCDVSCQVMCHVTVFIVQLRAAD